MTSAQIIFAVLVGAVVLLLANLAWGAFLDWLNEPPRDARSETERVVDEERARRCDRWNNRRDDERVTEHLNEPL